MPAATPPAGTPAPTAAPTAALTAAPTAAPAPMSPERWRAVEAVLDGALDLPPADRAGYLAAACGGDAALRAEVERLLAASDDAGGPLGATGERPAAAYAAPLVADTLDAAVALGGPAARPAPPPARVGPWRVTGVAGEGGMGTVYAAERDDGLFRMRAAVKVVRRGLHLDDHFVARFVAERQILARLEHPNVARLLDGGLTDDGLPYFVMEYVDGEPVDRWCDARRLSVEARLELFCRACGAVAYAHRRGVVHRDLKPSNILVAADGEPKLVDFGIAKLLRDAAAAHTSEYPAAGGAGGAGGAAADSYKAEGGGGGAFSFTIGADRAPGAALPARESAGAAAGGGPNAGGAPGRAGGGP